MLESQLKDIILKNSVCRACGCTSLVRLDIPNDLPDATSKWLINDHSGSPYAVAIYSNENFPGFVKRSVYRAKLAKDALSFETSRHILIPIEEGEVYGISYAIFPYCKPLNHNKLLSFIQKHWISSSIYNWLFCILQETHQVPDEEKLNTRIYQSLEFIQNTHQFSNLIRHLAEKSYKKLLDRLWQPKFVLMHNDLWNANILIDHRNVTGQGRFIKTRRFVIIDWAGSELFGFPFFDLIKLAISFNDSNYKLRKELLRHCKVLNCDPMDAMSYLLTALGYLGQNLECFPFSNYLALAEHCFQRLNQTINDG